MAATGTNIYNTNSGNVGIGTIDPQGKLTVFENSRYYYVNRRIGGYNYTEDSQGPNYILLHKAYDGTLMADYRVFGTISAIRGGTGAWNRKFNCEVNTATAYDRTRGSVICKNEGARLVTLRYGGVKYLAIEIANSSTLYNLQFTGWAYAPDGELLKLVYDQDVTEVTDFTGFDAITIQGGAHAINISVDTNTNMFNANHAGYKISHDTDYGGLTLLNLGSNRKDTVLFWGDDANDNLRFMFADSADSHRLKDRMIITGDGKVGIGTTSPSGKLSVYMGSGLGSVHIGGSNADLWFDGGDDSVFWISNRGASSGRTSITYGVTELLTVLNNGNVGIGTTAPGAKLHVEGGWLRVSNAGLANSAIQLEPQSGFHRIAFNQLRFWDWDTGGDMVTFENGNVGIGTTTPGQKLDVAGNIKVNQSGGIYFGGGYNPDTAYTRGGFLSFGDPGYSEDFIGYQANKFYFLDSPGGGDTAPPDVIIMGNVGIGTTAPNAKLQVSGGHISIDGGRFLTINPNDVFTYDGKTMAHYGLGWFGDSWFSGGPTAWFTAWGGIKLFTAGTPRMSITNGGNVGIGTTAPSYRLHVQGGDIYSSGYVRGGTGLCIGSDCRTSWPSESRTLNCSHYYSSGACNGSWYVPCPSGMTMTGGGIEGSFSSSYTRNDFEIKSKPYSNGWQCLLRDNDYYGNCSCWVRCCTIQ